MRGELKGECWHRNTEIDGVGFSLYNSGHIPGSSQLMIENGAKVLYTGDLNLRGGLITPPADTPQCDILIMEATFGLPRYTFPDKKEVVKEMKDWAWECLARGRTPVVLGYPLGKAQELTKAVSEDFAVVVEESAFFFNKRAENLGIELGEYFPMEAMDRFSARRDCAIIAPPHKAKMFREEGFFVALASGWAVNWAGTRHGASAGFPLSDHSGFYDLLDFVEKVSPQAVYTTHGYAHEFSSYLRERGFYSEPLSEVQTKLDSF